MNRERNHCPCVLTLQNLTFNLRGTRKVITTYGLYYLYGNDQSEVERKSEGYCLVLDFFISVP